MERSHTNGGCDIIAIIGMKTNGLLRAITQLEPKRLMRARQSMKTIKLLRAIQILKTICIMRIHVFLNPSGYPVKSSFAGPEMESTKNLKQT